MVGDNVEIGVYPIRKALDKAEELELDLVEISPKAKPPVCKIIDYKKFLYEQKKREKAMKAKAAAQCQQRSNYDNNEELKIKAEKANRKNAKTASTFEIHAALQKVRMELIKHCLRFA